MIQPLMEYIFNSPKEGNSHIPKWYSYRYYKYCNSPWYTMELMNSKGAFCLPRWVYLLQTSVAFFLTFHDATFHMRCPFEYPQIIAHFHRVIGCFLEWFRITPKNNQLLYENWQLSVHIQMGASYERWHHERSEKRPLMFVEAIVSS